MTALSSLRIALIGGGNMARGLLGGLIAKGADPAFITVVEPDAAVRRRVQQDFGVAVTSESASAIHGAAVVVLAVKPQIMAQVVRPLATSLQQLRPLIISVAAGIRTASLADWLGPGVPIVRCMPNRPALIGAGATGLYADASVGAAERALAAHVLESTGLAVWVTRESDLDVVTALSGSGPAYFFQLAELMAEAAIAQGLDAAVARQLAAQTLAGTGQLVAAESAPDLARMRAEVTSKGGTTEAALNCFSALALDRAVAEAMQAAATRSRELAEQFGKQP
jgi:pyrroline-5-carboxylate reductase